MKKVVIVVPVYTMGVNTFENVALMQLHRVLGHYPIFYVMPERLREHFRESLLHIVSFPDSYFVSAASYSQLCLSAIFYEIFQEYEYMLIYQTDAFVFSDRLMEFCELGYDYIGAPLPRMSQYWHELRARVGNGGLSLRRISSVLRVLQQKQTIISQVGFLEKAIMQYEDLFFGYCGTVSALDFHVPPIALAASFSIENDVGHCYRRLNRSLPFGCHAWYSVNYPIWREKIEGYGYVLPPTNSSIDTAEARRKSLMTYLIKRMLRRDTFRMQMPFLGTLFPESQYSVWGGGKDGEECIKILKNMGKTVCCVYDTLHCRAMEKKFGIPCLPPRKETIQKGIKVIVASSKNEDEMTSFLEEWGFSRDRDYVLYSCYRKKMLRNYAFAHVVDRGAKIGKAK